jgi:hypothetical protein
MSQTYDPIVERTELRRLRIGSPLRAPELGTAIVLERAVGAPVVVGHGDRVPDARTGNYRRMYLVDVANRGLSFTINAPSADAAFPFTVTVRFACRVVDPVAVVRDGVRDMTAALLPSLGAVVRETAARFDALQPTAAEGAIADRLNSAYPSRTLELGAYAVSVTPVDTEEFVTEQRKIRVHKMKYEAMKPIANGSREDMLAHVMSIDDRNPMAMLDRERADREAETRAQLDALRILMDKDGIEDFDAAEVRKQALSEFFPGGGTAGIGKRDSVRERLARRSSGAIEKGEVLEGNLPESGGEPAAKDQGGSNNGRASRLRGSMAPRPTDDR